jgi:hypothetical protein
VAILSSVLGDTDMSNAALKISETEHGDITPLYLAYSSPAPALPPVFGVERRIVWLTAVLVTLQVLDGILTYSGMYTFGLYAEGNPLLRGLMGLFGVLPAIALTKIFCIAIVLALCSQAHKISWLPVALTGIAGVYAFAAILPWSWLLLSEYLMLS